MIDRCNVSLMNNKIYIMNITKERVKNFALLLLAFILIELLVLGLPYLLVYGMTYSVSK
jgi:hypothetical protein